LANGKKEKIGKMNNIFDNKLISKEEINLIRKKIEDTIWDNKEKKLTRASFLLTEDCNLNCTYCFENKSRNKNKMTPQVAIAAIEYLIKGAKLEGEKAISITFFGGEPTLNLPIMDLIINYGSYRTNQENIQMQCNIITNATIYNEELENLYKKWKQKLGYLDIQLSIDGMPEFQDKNRPFVNGAPSSAIIEQNIEKYIKLFKKLNCQDYSVHVHSVINKASIGKMFDNYIYFLNKGLPRIWFMPCHEEEWSDEDVEIYRIEKQKIADYIYNKCLEENNAEFLNSYSSLAKCALSHPGKPCGMGWNYCTITAAGDIYPCHSVYFQNKELKIGNVLECIDDIESRRFFLDYTTENLFGDMPCGECDNYNCYRCIGQNYANNGNFLIGFPQYCKLSRVEDEIRKDLRNKLINNNLLPEERQDGCEINNNQQTFNEKVFLEVFKEIDNKYNLLEKNIELLNNKIDGLIEINNILTETLIEILNLNVEKEID